MASDGERCRGEDVIVVGGGNSAGQAAVHLSRLARSVRVVVRGDGLAATMSRYLVERIESRPNIELVTQTEVSAVHGNGRLEHADLRDADGAIARVAVSALFVMIGADPCTEAVHRMLDLDAAGYITCGAGAAGCDGAVRWPTSDRQPHLLETVSAGRVRRRRRARGRDEARLRRGRRRRPRRPLRARSAAVARKDRDGATPGERPWRWSVPRVPRDVDHPADVAPHGTTHGAATRLSRP